MNGAVIVGQLLREFAPLLQVVESANIKGGRLPLDAGLPALLVRRIGGSDRQPLKRQATVRVTERIAVTVRAANYRQQGQVIDLVRSCCAGQVGDVGGGRGVSILTAGLGPDVDGPGDTFEQTQDFRVSYDAPFEAGESHE